MKLSQLDTIIVVGATYLGSDGFLQSLNIKDRSSHSVSCLTTYVSLDFLSFEVRLADNSSFSIRMGFSDEADF